MFLHLSVILSIGGVWQTPPRQTPPWADRDGYCSGRYASYWNAFLCWIKNTMARQNVTDSSFTGTYFLRGLNFRGTHTNQWSASLWAASEQRGRGWGVKLVFLDPCQLLICLGTYKIQPLKKVSALTKILWKCRQIPGSNQYNNTMQDVERNSKPKTKALLEIIRKYVLAILNRLFLSIRDFPNWIP